MFIGFQWCKAASRANLQITHTIKALLVLLRLQRVIIRGENQDLPASILPHKPPAVINAAINVR